MQIIHEITINFINCTKSTLSDVIVLDKASLRCYLYPDCASVADIAEKNIDYFSGPRDVLIDMGYQPCKRCNP